MKLSDIMGNAGLSMYAEVALVIFLLAKFKFVTARQLVHGWRYAVVAIALVGALITPTVDSGLDCVF